VAISSPYWRRRREFLRELPLFASSTEPELRVFDRLAGEIWVERGADLIHEGARGVEFAVVAEGHVVVERGGRALAVLGAGDFVGELALLDGRARTATVSAATRTRLLVLGIDEFAVVMRDVPSLRAHVEAAAAVRRDGVPVVPAPAFGVAGAADRRPHRRSVVLPAIVALVLLGSGLGAWWVAGERTRTTTVDLADAVADFRSENAAAVAVAPAPTSPPPTRPAQSARPAPETTVAPAPPTTSPKPSSDGAPPAPGVYTYVTDGWESVSVLGGRHEYPTRSYAVVRTTGGCRWEVEHRIIDEHVDHHGRCTEGDAVGLTSEAREVEFFGQRDGLRYACDPTAARFLLDESPGTVTVTSCRTAGDEMQVTARREGSVPFVIGGVRVDAVHVRFDVVLRGRADGTAAVDFWLHPESGLILKEHRVVDTHADAAFGDVRYREEVTLRLESLTPVR
jgi:hypothetical protein